MKVVLLAGGFGTRLAEYTESIPKPMVPVGGKPTLWHIMQQYASYGHKDFYLALGYKAQVVKEYFLNYRALNADFTVDLQTGSVKPHQLDEVDWCVTLVDTGLQTMTGGRVKRMQPFIGNETFLLTYGDGVADVDIGALVAHHRQESCLVTLTAVQPPGRYGALHLEGNAVHQFQEKPDGDNAWINGGFFVLEPSVLDRINGDLSSWEEDVLPQLAADGQLSAYRHSGFWQPMDTLRDRNRLEELWEKGDAPWKVW